MGARALSISYRNRELLYLAVVGVLTGIGFASVYIARQSVVSWGSLGYAVFFFALYLAAHLVTRITVPNADPYLLPMAGLLTAVGVTEIYRLGVSDAFKQGLWIVVGVALFALALWRLRRDYRILEQYKYLFGIGAIVLLFLPRVPGLGTTVNGARLWVHVGQLHVPAGRVLEDLPDRLPRRLPAREARAPRPGAAEGDRAAARDLGRLHARARLVERPRLGPSLLRDLPRDALRRDGAPLVRRRRHRPVRRGGYVAYERIPHVHERVTIWLHPWTSQKVYCPSTGGLALRQDCESYQLVKSLYSIANGGFGGAGLGKGTFATTDGHPLIPYVNSDFIYSALAQELGLVGAAALLLVFMLFVARGMKIALQADDGFSKLLAAGLTFGFALQTFIIVGGVLRIIPLTGITLPFVSYGGSSVVANFLLLAGLLLVSDRANDGRMNKQISRLAMFSLLLLASLIVATTYWQSWEAPSLAAKQDNAIQRVAQFRIKRGLIYAADGKTLLAANVAVKGAGGTLYFRRYPTHGLAAQVVGYSTQGRSRAGIERQENAYLTAAEREPRHDLRQAHRPPQGHDGDGQQPRAEPAAGRAVARREGAAGNVRRGGRAQPEDRPGVRDGVVARATTRTRSSRRAGTRSILRSRAPARARRRALFNRATAGPVRRPARRSRRSRPRLRSSPASTRPTRASTTPATASSTACRCTTRSTRTAPSSSATST